MRPILPALIALLLPSALAAQRPQIITPSVTLIERIDPIDDTDHSAVMLSSDEGIPSGRALAVDWRCDGRQASLGLFFPAAVAGWSRVIWRFDAAAADTLPLEEGPPMRVYGGPGAWMVMDKPLKVVGIPDSLRAAFTRRARGARRLVVRLDGPRGQRDWFFDLRGLSGALDRLSCVTRPRPAPAPPPQVLGEPAGPLYYPPSMLDVAPVPADSAAVAAALAREIPARALRDVGAGELTAFLSISAEGMVDSVYVMAMDREREAAAVRFFRSIRFTPARREGKPAPASILVDLQARDPREELRMP